MSNRAKILLEKAKAANAETAAAKKPSYVDSAMKQKQAYDARPLGPSSNSAPKRWIPSATTGKGLPSSIKPPGLLAKRFDNLSPPPSARKPPPKPQTSHVLELDNDLHFHSSPPASHPPPLRAAPYDFEDDGPSLQPKSVERLTAPRPALPPSSNTFARKTPAADRMLRVLQKAGDARYPRPQPVTVLDETDDDDDNGENDDRTASHLGASGSGLDRRLFPNSSGTRNPFGSGAGSGSGRTRDLIHVGLSNLGNTCFMNATLQALLGLETFVFDLASPDITALKLPAASLHAALLDCAQKLWLPVVAHHRRHPHSSLLHQGGAGHAISPYRLKRALEEKAPLFRGSRQHDAHEFLVALLDSMEQEILAAQAQRAGRADVPISEALCPTARNCVFVVTRKVTCHACGHESDGKELYNHLSIEVPDAPSHTAPAPSLDALVLAAFAPEEIHKRCEKCACADARHVILRAICQLPRHLIVHLKRFRADSPAPRTAAPKTALISSYFPVGSSSKSTAGGVRKVTTPVALCDALSLGSVCGPAPGIPCLHPKLRDLDAGRGKENDASPDLARDLGGGGGGGMGRKRRGDETVITVEDDGGAAPHSPAFGGASAPPSQRRRVGSPPGAVSPAEEPPLDLTRSREGGFRTPGDDDDDDDVLVQLPTEAEAEAEAERGPGAAAAAPLPPPAFRAARLVADPAPSTAAAGVSPDLGASAPDRTPPVPSFRLSSVVCHLGDSPAAGHYVTDRVDVARDRWLRFNDSLVLDLQQSRAEFLRDAQRQQEAYILVFSSQGACTAPRSAEGILEALGAALTP